MKTIKYHCEACEKEIYDNQFLEISAAESETGFSVRNYFDGQVRQMSNWSEMHFCSEDCLVSMFFGRRKKLSEPIIEAGIENIIEDPVQIFDKSEVIVEDAVSHHSNNKPEVSEVQTPPGKPKPCGWPKGKPRGPKIAENLRKNKIEAVKEIHTEVQEIPKAKGRKSADNDVFYQKLEFAKSLGYESISAAMGQIDKYEFEKQFEKSQYSNNNFQN